MILKLNIDSVTDRTTPGGLLALQWQVQSQQALQQRLSLCWLVTDSQATDQQNSPYSTHTNTLLHIQF